MTLNPELYDRSKPRAAIQLMILGTTRYFPTVYDQAQRQLDKSTLLSVID